MAANRSPGRLTTKSAMSAVRCRTPSTVTIESMPPPNGMSGRKSEAGAGTAAAGGEARAAGAAAFARAGAGAAGAGAAVGAIGGGTGAEGEVAEVKAVAVGVLAQAREVELAQERKLALGQRGVAEVDDRAARRSCSRRRPRAGRRAARPPARRGCPSPARARATPAPRTPARPASTGRSAAPAPRRRQTPRTGRPGRARARLLLKRLASSSRASLPTRKRRQPRPAARHAGLCSLLAVIRRQRGPPRRGLAASRPAPGLSGLSRGTAPRLRRHGGPVHDHVNSAANKLRNSHDHEKSFRFCRARALAPQLSPRTALTVTADHLSHGVAWGSPASTSKLLAREPHGHRAPLQPRR